MPFAGLVVLAPKDLIDQSCGNSNIVEKLRSDTGILIILSSTSANTEAFKTLLEIKKVFVKIIAEYL
jgi:hypothetical protein